MVGTVVTICCLCTFYATDEFESAADKRKLWGEEEQNFTPVHYAIQESATEKSQIY
jgi:hypothetical protein